MASDWNLNEAWSPNDEEDVYFAPQITAES